MNKAEYDDAFGVSNDKQPDLGMHKVKVKSASLKSKAAKEQRKTNTRSNIVLGLGVVFFIIAICFLCYFFLYCKLCKGSNCASCFAFILAFPQVIAPLLFLFSIIPFILASRVTMGLEKIKDSSIRKRIRLKNRIGLALLLLSIIMIIMPCVVVFSWIR